MAAGPDRFAADTDANELASALAKVELDAECQLMVVERTPTPGERVTTAAEMTSTANKRTSMAGVRTLATDQRQSTSGEWTPVGERKSAVGEWTPAGEKMPGDAGTARLDAE